VGVAFQRIQHKHRPRPVRQCGNGHFKADLLVLGFTVLDVDVIDIEAVLEVFLLPEIAQDRIGGNPVKPAAKGTVSTKLREVTSGLDKCLLGHVLSHVAVIQQAHTKRKHFTNMLMVKRLIRPVVIVFRPLYELSFVYT